MISRLCTKAAQMPETRHLSFGTRKDVEEHSLLERQLPLKAKVSKAIQHHMYLRGPPGGPPGGPPPPRLKMV